MRIIEESGQKLVLVNEAERRLALIWRRILLLVGIWAVFTALYVTGLIPYTEQYELLFKQGYFNIRSLLIGLLAAIFCFAYAFRFTYAYVTFDKAKGEMQIGRVRFFSPRTVGVIRLSDIRCATVSERENLYRLEFELRSSEMLAPTQTYTNYYSLDTLRDLIEKINRYLR
jgi:hypothetical protein